MATSGSCKNRKNRKFGREKLIVVYHFIVEIIPHDNLRWCAKFFSSNFSSFASRILCLLDASHYCVSFYSWVLFNAKEQVVWTHSNFCFGNKRKIIFHTEACIDEKYRLINNTKCLTPVMWSRKCILARPEGTSLKCILKSLHFEIILTILDAGTLKSLARF